MLSKRLDFLGYKVPVVVPVLLVAALLIWMFLVSRPKERVPLAISTVEVGDNPQAIGTGPLGVYVAHGGDETLRRIDPGSGEAGEGIALGTLPGAVVVTDDTIWVGSIAGREIVRVIPGEGGSDAEVSFVKTGRTPQALALGDGVLWVAAFDDGSISKVDLDSGEVVGDPIELEDAFPSALAFGFGSLWVADVVDDTVIRLDPATGEIEETISVGESPTGIAVDDHGVWVANFNDSTVSHIDPTRNAPKGEAVVVGGQPGGIAAGEGYIWVSRQPRYDEAGDLVTEGAVIRIDPTETEWTGEVFEVGEAPQGIAVGAGSIWVADQESDTVTRLMPER
jgi:YVTN family beta-propeller protein